MGWLGYSEDVTLATRIPALELAYDGHLEKLQLMNAGRIVPAESIAPTGPPPADAVLNAFRLAAAPKK